MTAVGWSFVALVAWVVLPGVAIVALAARSNAVTPVRALAVGLAGGLSVWFVGSTVLARLGVMTTTGVAVTTAVIGLVALAVIGGPGRAGARSLAHAAVGMELAVMVGAAVVAALPLVVLILVRQDSLTGPTPWYYLELARDVTRAHGFPAGSAEWATRLPFLDDYPGFTSATAVLMAVGGPRSMAAVQVVRLVTLLVVGAAAYLFARGFGAARSAAAVSVVVLFAGITYAGKLASYRPESTAYALVFLVAVLAKLWMDEGRRTDLVLANVALVALSAVHGIAWLFAALIIGGLVVATIAFATRHRRAAVGAGLVLGLSLLAGWLLGNLVLGGGLSGAGKLGGLPGGSGADPTWRFVNLVAGHLDAGARTSASEIARRGIARGVVGLDPWWYLAAALVVTVILVAVAWRARPVVRTQARVYTVMAGLVLVATAAISISFTLRWSTYVPLRTGWGRLFPLTYALLPAAIALVISAFSARRTRLVAAALVLVLGAVVTVHGRDFYDQTDRQQPGRTQLRALRDLGLAREDLVLTNVYSEGFVGAVVGARGVLDGRAPYSEPHTLTRANRLLAESIRFFADPAASALPRGATDTDYVLVATDDSALGTPLRFATNVAALDLRPDLRLAREGPGFRLYAVHRDAP